MGQAGPAQGAGAVEPPDSGLSTVELPSPGPSGQGSSSSGPRCMLSPFRPGVRTLSSQYRTVSKFLDQRSLVRATKAVPRTIRFVSGTLIAGEVAASVPRPPFTVSLVAQVAIDEALLAMAMTPRRFPRRADYHRVGQELADAQETFRRRGWIASPAAYHRTPPALEDGDVTHSRGWSLGTGYERIAFDSGFAPHAGEPGEDRWRAFKANCRASATILRHPGEPRPWVVAVHGFCMGFPLTDFRGLHVDLLHKELGLNVAMPVLPLHGRRRATLVSGEPFLSFELMNAVHGMTQSIWDIRRLIRWVRAQGAPSISLYGVSLGGYIASLLAGLEDGLDTVVAGSRSRTSRRSSMDIARITSPAAPSSTGYWVALPGLPVVSPLSTSPRSYRVSDASYTPATGTAWPRRARPSGSGSTGTGPRSAGTPATTSCTCGTARYTPSSATRSARPEGGGAGAASGRRLRSDGDDGGHVRHRRQVPLL